jgi:hypothetical protein
VLSLTNMVIDHRTYGSAKHAHMTKVILIVTTVDTVMSCSRLIKITVLHPADLVYVSSCAIRWTRSS